ncbi:BAB2_0123 family type IV secretion system effector [Phyllobacterium sp. K27]
MSLLLVNLILLGLSAVSLIVFFAALRKASKLTAMSRLMANQVASSANNLQKALAILQAEREICRDESIRLEARLKDSDRVRSEMARAMELIKRARLDLNEDALVAAAMQQPAAAPHIVHPTIKMNPVNHFVSDQLKSAPQTHVGSNEPARTLPVFVNRIVRSSDVAGAVL